MEKEKQKVNMDDSVPQFVQVQKPEGTGYQRFHPTMTALHLMTVMLLTMFMSNPWILGLGCVSGLTMSIMLNHGKGSGRYYLWMVLFALCLCVANPLFVHRGQTILFFVNNNPITLEALVYGAVSSVLLLGILFWCRVWNEIMTTSRLMFLLGRSFPRIGLVLTCALRFLPLLVSRWKEIRRAQLVIGQEARGLRATAQQFSALVSWSMEHAILMAISMRGRGYGLKGRKNYSNYRWHKCDIGLLIFVLLTAVPVIYAVACGALTWTFYPTLEQPVFSAASVFGYIGYGALAFFPVLFELGDWGYWKFLRRKI